MQIITTHQLHINITQNHPAYKWAIQQLHREDALGHIGTHLDTFSTVPLEATYELEVLVIDSRKAMPNEKEIASLDIKNKALIFYTDTLNTCGYGTHSYVNAKTFISKNTLDNILISPPAFILIDSFGIEDFTATHYEYDHKCAKRGCFIIKNIILNEFIAKSIKKIIIQLDLDNLSSGKPCKIYAICHHT